MVNLMAPQCEVRVESSTLKHSKEKFKSHLPLYEEN